MEEVKKTGDYKIFKKRNGRYGVRAKDGKWINGMDKAEILSKEGLIKWEKPKNPPPEAPPAEEASEAAPEAPPADEAPAEDKKEEQKEEKVEE